MDEVHAYLALERVFDRHDELDGTPCEYFFQRVRTRSAYIFALLITSFQRLNLGCIAVFCLDPQGKVKAFYNTLYIPAFQPVAGSSILQFSTDY